MAKIKYKVGLRVQIKHSVSKNGAYASYAGKYGSIRQMSGHWGASGSIKKIELEDGTVLRDVGKSVIKIVHSSFKKAGNNKMYKLFDNEGLDGYPGLGNETTLEHMEVSKKKLKKLLKEVEAKVEFLNETGSEIFSPKQFKAYNTLKLIQSNENLTLKEQAEMLSEIM